MKRFLPLSIAAVSVLMGFETNARADEIDTCVEAASSGQKLRDQGKFIEAKVSFQRCTAHTCPAPVQRDCANWFGAIESRTPRLLLRVTSNGTDVSDARVLLDDVALAIDGRGILVNPGRHVLRVTLVTGEQETVNVVVTEGEQRTVNVAIARRSVEPEARRAETPAVTAPRPTREPEPEASMNIHKVLGGGLMGLGTAALAGAAVVAVIGYSEWRALGDRCEPNLCAASEVQGTKTKFVVADVLAVSGLVTGTVGALLFFVFAPSASAQALRPKGLGFTF
jgi:hypothetical protein